MNDSRTSADTLDQVDEEILTYTVSDEALEAAAGALGAATYESRCYINSLVSPVPCC